MTFGITVTLPGGLDDILRAGAGTQPSGMAFGTDADGDNVTLVAVTAPQGSMAESGITESADGSMAVIVAYASQFSQLKAVNDSVVAKNFNTAETANLTAPNGDVVNFTFNFPQQS